MPKMKNRLLKKFKYTNSIPTLISNFILLNILFSCNSQERYFVDITNRVDPDIVLVNIGNVNRATIGEMLLMIYRCNPKVIGFDGWFLDERGSSQDSVLISALDSIQNDVLAYYIDSTNSIIKSNTRFSSLADEGLVAVEEIKGLASAITPIQTINNIEHSLFALKISKLWEPEFKTSLKTNQTIPIKYTRMLDQFIHFDYSDLKDVAPETLRNKIILLGFLGPGNEDKHFTPIRLTRAYDTDDPDTYGLVIIANEIRTILDYEKK
jgi:CHASE2 domain-containing sensor protein